MGQGESRRASSVAAIESSAAPFFHNTRRVQPQHFLMEAAASFRCEQHTLEEQPEDVLAGEATSNFESAHHVLEHQPDLLPQIVSYLKNDHIFVAGVSKSWRRTWLSRCRTRYAGRKTSRLSAIGSLSRLHWALDCGHGRTWKKHVIKAVVTSGKLDVLRWLSEEGVLRPDDDPIDGYGRKVCAWAAAAGRRDVVEWALANGFPGCDVVCYRAAGGGQLALLVWARENNFPWTAATCVTAAAHGHLPVLQWARQNGCAWNSLVCSKSARGGHLDVLKWARAHGCKWTVGTCSLAACCGNLELLIWARANGCPWDRSTCTAATHGRNPAVLQWIHENGCPCDHLPPAPSAAAAAAAQDGGEAGGGDEVGGGDGVDGGGGGDVGGDGEQGH